MELSNKPNGVASKTAKENDLIQSSPISRDNGGSETSEHPLLNPLVVDKIVEHLNPSFEQLKTFRLVSKVWTEVTLHHWRNSCAVLTLVTEHPSFLTQPKSKNGRTVSQFFTEFQDPQSPFQLSEKPFSKYKFKGLTFDIRECNKSGGPAQAFWNTIGPLIKSLYFENCIFLKPEPVKTVTCPMAQLLIGLIPNVKDLVLNDVKTEELEKSSVPEEEDFQVFAENSHLNLRTLTLYGNGNTDTVDMNLKDLFKMAPNLESIKGVDLPNAPMSEQALIEPIYQVRFRTGSDGDPASLSNLKHLDLINSSTFLEKVYPWQSLIPPKKKNKEGNIRQLPLESLALHLEAMQANLGYYEDPDVTRNLEKYLKSFSGTLKTLQLLRLPVGPPYLNFLGDTSGVEMTLLKELDLWGTIVPDFGFLNNTPNLKRLRVDFGCFGKRDRLRDCIKEHSDDYGEQMRYRKQDLVINVSTDLRDAILCSELEHLEIDFEFPEESLRLLGKWMPNLKRLDTILNVETVPVVCEVWRDLTELVCLHGSKIENSCFIWDEEKAGFSGSPLTKLKICDLNELERFQLDTYCGESELTDDVIFKGFLKMHGLKSVQICVNSQMTAKAEEALRKGVPFCKLNL